ncbi:hypothetical protein F2Q69_00003789 [Brassica cretica]|uniref:Uncharacterized protein n=1 Tax=Brassica cretica TaxID=69181 RepID=A0A8S9P7M7_BRACR|nr:hypothetical protein F2Q69_00003789 [Brassica cretica]
MHFAHNFENFFAVYAGEGVDPKADLMATATNKVLKAILILGFLIHSTVMILWTEGSEFDVRSSKASTKVFFSTMFRSEHDFNELDCEVVDYFKAVCDLIMGKDGRPDPWMMDQGV